MQGHYTLFSYFSTLLYQRRSPTLGREENRITVFLLLLLMVGLVVIQGYRSIQLFHEDQTNQLVGKRQTRQGQDRMGLLYQSPGRAVSATNDKYDTGPVPYPTTSIERISMIE